MLNSSVEPEVVCLLELVSCCAPLPVYLIWEEGQHVIASVLL